MSWSDFLLARQLLTEERIGAPLREAQRAEDDVVDRSIAELRRDRGTR